MTHWKPIAAGSGVVALTLLSYAMIARQGENVAASDEPASSEKKSFLERITGPLRQETAAVPAGTRIHVRLEQAVNSERNSAGDTFTAWLDGPLTREEKVLAPSRSKVYGMLTQVTPSGRVKGRASMTMVLRKLVVNGKEYDLNTQPLGLAARSTKKKDAAIIGGAAAAGAAIGAIAGGGKGAAIGAGVGGGSGTGYVLATKGEPVAYGPEARFTFTLTEPVELPVVRETS